MKRFLWNRHLYDVGAVDVKTGTVMECHTEKQVEAWDNNCCFAFSYEQDSAVNLGESLYFWLDEDGTVLFDKYDVEENKLEGELERLRVRILEQVKIK